MIHIRFYQGRSLRRTAQWATLPRRYREAELIDSFRFSDSGDADCARFPVSAGEAARVIGPADSVLSR